MAQQPTSKIFIVLSEQNTSQALYFKNCFMGMKS